MVIISVEHASSTGPAVMEEGRRSQYLWKFQSLFIATKQDSKPVAPLVKLQCMKMIEI